MEYASYASEDIAREMRRRFIAEGYRVMPIVCGANGRYCFRYDDIRTVGN